MSSRDSSGCVLSDVWSAGSVGHLVGAAVAGACAGGRELDVYDSFRTPENTCHQGLVAITYYMRLKKKNGETSGVCNRQTRRVLDGDSVHQCTVVLVL